MRKTSLKAHIRLDKGNVSSNQEGPQARSGALGEQKARGTDTVTPQQGSRNLRLAIRKTPRRRSAKQTVTDKDVDVEGS